MWWFNHVTYCFLLKQYRGVTIENRRAAKRTATRSALLYGGFYRILLLILDQPPPISFWPKTPTPKWTPIAGSLIFSFGIYHLLLTRKKNPHWTGSTSSVEPLDRLNKLCWAKGQAQQALLRNNQQALLYLVQISNWCCHFYLMLFPSVWGG